MVNERSPGDPYRYEVGRLLASTSSYRLYFARQAPSGRTVIVQIAQTTQDNGRLDRAAFVLNRLKAAADELDVEYSRTHDGSHLHYDRLYPALVESFVSDKQGNRRINVLSLTGVDDITQTVPFARLLTKERLRVDPETSAWIMGRLLKLMTFAHSEGISNRALTANNVLLEPEQHYAITLDWSVARLFPGPVPREQANLDIRMAAQAVFRMIGGSVETGNWPYEGHEPYIALLRGLTIGTEKSAEHVLDRFYASVRNIYGQHFHPFNPLPL